MGEAFDFVIAGGTVYDGTGAAGAAADVGVRAGEIAAVGDLSAADAGRTIGAGGLAVAPGFIDAHTHSDLPSLLAPLAESRLYAGVTTEICGSCGYAAGPFRDADREHFLEHYEGLEITWHTQGEFFSRLEEAGSAINRAFLAGHGNIRRTAMGGDFDRAARAAEVAAMRRLLGSEIEAGAIGMSTGLIYPPGCFASKEEIADVAAVLADTGLVYATHMRSEGDALIESLEESLFIARTARCPLHISHLKVYEPENWHKIDQLRRWWSGRGGYGVRVSADRYPYTASHTLLNTLLPQWAHEGGVSAERERLESDRQWARISRELSDLHGDGEFWETARVASTFSKSNRRFEGKTLAEVARRMGTEPIDAVRALLIADKCRTMAIFFRMSEANMLEIFSWGDVVVGSDSGVRAAAGATTKGFPHPRSYGTTGRIFRLLVRESKVVDLPSAIHRLTGAVADIFGLEARGKIAPGCAADIVIFDPAEIADRATYDKPSAFTVGVKHLFVNGRGVLADGEVTGDKPGRVLRHGR